jgi:TolB-like protein/DNA-binding winged helix-turn-helix (wHTH) protein
MFMQQAELYARNLKFGVFEVDLRAGELTKLGRRVRLQDQPFQLLAMLLEKPGTLVTREELHVKLWPETTVDFDHGLNKAISKIREALGDSAENPRFIETVARRGYRFLADVTVVGAAQLEAAAADGVSTKIAPDDSAVQQIPYPARPGETDLAPRSKLRSLSWRIFGIVPVLAIALTIIFYPWTHAAPKIHSIVVLPLVSLSSDPSQEFFADGMTDELITDLAQVRRLRVVSSALALGYKGTRQPLVEVARELDVDAVVKGTVLLVGDRVRINVRLIDVSTGRDVWAKSYERDVHDTLKLQSEIASQIVEQFRIILNRQERALDAEGQTGDGSTKAVEHVSHAIAAEPDDTKSYLGLRRSLISAACVRITTAVDEDWLKNPNIHEFGNIGTASRVSLPETAVRNGSRWSNSMTGFMLAGVAGILPTAIPVLHRIPAWASDEISIAAI